MSKLDGGSRRIRFAVSKGEGEGVDSRGLAPIRDLVPCDGEVEVEDMQMTKSVEMEDVELGEDGIVTCLLGLGYAVVREGGRM